MIGRAAVHRTGWQRIEHLGIPRDYRRSSPACPSPLRSTAATPAEKLPRRLHRRLHASLSMGIREKLTNVVEITLATTLLVPQPHRFPDTLQAEDKLCEGELPAPPSTCWWIGGVEALTPQPPFTDPAGH